MGCPRNLSISSMGVPGIAPFKLYVLMLYQESLYLNYRVVQESHHLNYRVSQESLHFIYGVSQESLHFFYGCPRNCPI